MSQPMDDDRVRSLLDAVLAIGSDLDLQAVLRRIIEVAVTLADASYGTLGVISSDGQGCRNFSLWASRTRQSTGSVRSPPGTGCWGS